MGAPVALPELGALPALGAAAGAAAMAAGIREAGIRIKNSQPPRIKIIVMLYVD